MFLCDMPIHTYILSVHKCVCKLSCFFVTCPFTYILSVHICVCKVSCFLEFQHAKVLGAVVFWQLNWEHPLKHYLSKRTNTYLHLVDLFSHSCVSNRCSSKTTWPFSRNNWILNRWNISLVGLLHNEDSKMQGERTRFGRSQTTWNSHQTKHRQGPLKCWSFRFLFCSLLFSVMFKCNLKAAKHSCGKKREIQSYLKVVLNETIFTAAHYHLPFVLIATLRFNEDVLLQKAFLYQNHYYLSSLRQQSWY